MNTHENIGNHGITEIKKSMGNKGIMKSWGNHGEAWGSCDRGNHGMKTLG